jgi:hypothetical protein
MLLRFLLLLVTGYIIWRLVKAVMTLLMQPGSGRSQQSVHNGSAAEPPQPYVDIKDAEFEEIKSEKDSEDKNG